MQVDVCGASEVHLFDTSEECTDYLRGPREDVLLANGVRMWLRKAVGAQGGGEGLGGGDTRGREGERVARGQALGGGTRVSCTGSGAGCQGRAGQLHGGYRCGVPRARGSALR